MIWSDRAPLVGRGDIVRGPVEGNLYEVRSIAESTISVLRTDGSTSGPMASYTVEHRVGEPEAEKAEVGDLVVAKNFRPELARHLSVNWRLRVGQVVRMENDGHYVVDFLGKKDSPSVVREVFKVKEGDILLADGNIPYQMTPNLNFGAHEWVWKSRPYIDCTEEPKPEPKKEDGEDWAGHIRAVIEAAKKKAEEEEWCEEFDDTMANLGIDEDLYVRARLYLFEVVLEKVVDLEDWLKPRAFGEGAEQSGNSVDYEHATAHFTVSVPVRTATHPDVEFPREDIAEWLNGQGYEYDSFDVDDWEEGE